MNGSAVTWASLAPDGAARAAGGRAGPEALGLGRAAADGRRPGRGRRVPVLPPPCQGTAMAYQWPLRDFLEYGALPSAVPSARFTPVRSPGNGAFLRSVRMSSCW